MELATSQRALEEAKWAVANLKEDIVLTKEDLKNTTTRAWEVRPSPCVFFVFFKKRVSFLAFPLLLFFS